MLAVAILFLGFPQPLLAAANTDALVLGVFPYISASQMMDQLSPLIKRIENTLGKEIVMVSAPDFKSFVERTSKGEYDIIITGAHMGLLAEKRDGWQRVVQSGQQLATVVLVHQQSNIHNLADLRGKKMAVGNILSITYLLAEKALAQEGIDAKKDMNIIETATFSNVVESVFLGEVEAGATALLLWDSEQVKTIQRQQLRDIFLSKSRIPAFLIMTNPKIDKESVNILTKSLLNFRDTSEGRAFLQKSQFKSFHPLDNTTMELAEPYVHVFLEEQAAQ
jgi:phosphonate transport system substrate-binding protein